MKTVLSIQSQVAGARVGNSVAAFAMERLGVRVLAVPTTLLGRRPDRGPPGGRPIAAETLSSIFAALEADGQFPRIDAVLSGYLAAPEQADAIASVVSRIKAANPYAVYVCDPVMGDEGRLYVSTMLVDAFSNTLTPIADLIAPNAFELSVLAGASVTDLPSAWSAVNKLGKTALVSSIPRANEVCALFAQGEHAIAMATPLLPHSARGAGDLFTALFLVRMIKGESDDVALSQAMGATYDVIAAGGEDLALPEMQDALATPHTNPRRIEIGV